MPASVRRTTYPSIVRSPDYHLLEPRFADMPRVEDAFVAEALEARLDEPEIGRIVERAHRLLILEDFVGRAKNLETLGDVRLTIALAYQLVEGGIGEMGIAVVADDQVAVPVGGVGIVRVPLVHHHVVGLGLARLHPS